jgi:hypothetical protein
MSDVINYERPQVPVRLEDLAQFVLVGRDKLNMVRAGIKALDKLDVAEGVRRQKKDEAAMLAEALLDAEVRIGEILAAMPKASGGDRGNQYTGGKIASGVDFANSKMKAAEQLGFNSKQVERFQTLAENKDIVEQIKQEAREADDLPTRTAVLNVVSANLKQAKEEYRILKEQERFEQLEKKTQGVTIPADQKERMDLLDAGITVVINMNRDSHILKYATDAGIYVRCDRFSEWGNPFIMGVDGSRDEVIFNFEKHYLPFKRGLISKISELKGKALGCHCYPERCHCEILSKLANDEN